MKDFSRVYSISIQSGSTQPVDIVDTITVEEIHFYKSSHTSLVVSLFLCIFYFCVIFLFFRMKQYKKQLANKTGKVARPYKTIKIDHALHEEAQRIIKYIGENYSNRDLTAGMISRVCRIPVIKISSYLKKYFGLSFPRYLNTIRITEAKRLLKETDLKISEIAFRIGFNSIPHFNRVFKDNEKISPKDFRRTAIILPGENDESPGTGT